MLKLRRSVGAGLLAWLACGLMGTGLMGTAQAQLVSTDTLVGAPGTNGGAQGTSVSISADGNTAIVGGPGDTGFQGAAWVFFRSAGVWGAGGNKLPISGGSAFSRGTAVAVSADGGTFIVGSPFDSTNGGNAGAVWMFSYSGGVFTQEGFQKGTVGVQAGASVALSADGNTALVGAPHDTSLLGDGALYVYSRSGGTWSFVTALSATGTIALGFSAVSLSADGNTALAGAPESHGGAGGAWVFTRSGGTWSAGTQLPLGTPAITLGAGGQQGFGVALSLNGQNAIVGGYSTDEGTGASWVYTLSGGIWTQQAKLVGTPGSANTGQGISVALSSDGNVALVGGWVDNNVAGAAWEFTRSSGVWSQVAKLHGTAGSRAGYSVALSGDGNTALSGAYAGGLTGETFAYGAPDLAITHVHNGTFTRGQVGATYTIHVTNAGGAPTTGAVTVTDPIPSGLTATGFGGAGWQNCALTTVSSVTTASCNRTDALAAGAPYPDIVLTANVSTLVPFAIVNTAAVSGGGETETGNDTSTDLITLPQVADLAITKTHTGALAPGAVVTYTIVVKNAGTVSTSGTVTVLDNLPGGLSSPTLTASSGWSPCSFAGTTLTCSRGNALAGGASYPAITYTVTVSGSVGATIPNTAIVSCACDTNATNNSSTDSATLSGPGPDLSIGESHSGNFVKGQRNSYTITVRNIGSAPTVGQVMVVDNLPAGLNVIGMSGTGWTCATFLATCVRADPLAGGASYPPIRVTLSVAANSPANVTNVVTVSGGGDVNPANNSSSDLTAVQ